MKRLVQTVLVLALALGCNCIATATGTAYSIPKRAVFEGTSNSEFSDWGMWVSRLDGSEPKQVTSTVEEGPWGEDPVLSPDGLEIAYLRFEYHIWKTCIEVMSVDGGASQTVYCGDPSGVTWSPNGYELAFSDEGPGSDSTAIYVLNLKTEELHRVADWFYRQSAPSFSPDGSQIAFETIYNASEEIEAGIWVVNSNGTGLHQLTNEWQGEPSWSPDGKQLAVSAFGEYEEETEKEDAGGIELVNSSTGEVEKSLLVEDYEFEYDPHWTPNGKSISFTRVNEPGLFEGEEETFEVGEIDADGSEERYIFPEFYWTELFRPQETTGGLELETSYLLQRYSPRLHYDMQEQYFADSAAEATDGPENRILASNYETVLAAHEKPYPAPSLSLLGESEFAKGVIDEGPEYTKDAAKMHAELKYGNHAYGRVFEDPETGTNWLDYWFYYYYDSQEVLGIGVHEGDWEHVALRLDKEGIPDLAVYSRHGSETATCESSAVAWELSNSVIVSPNVYVANGSHANYFWPGEHPRETPRPTDDANGDGATITPEIAQVESAPYSSSTALPRWFYWNGHWGASTSEGFVSPLSPARNSDEWENLQAYAEAHEENCDATGLGGGSAPRQQSAIAGRAGGLPRPVSPEISAHRVGHWIVIRYDVSRHGAPAKQMLLSISAKHQLDATRTKTIRLRQSHGIVKLPRPYARGPYIAAASTFTGRKERSATSVANVLP
jgi:hypothetical protein